MQPRDKNIFTLNPTSLDMKRSVFSRNNQHKTSFNLGELVPIYLDEVLPGDTITMDLAEVIRMSTPIAPIMDNLYADVYFFFVPNRIVWNHWQQFCGENDTSAWTQTTSYTIPVQDVGSSGDPVGIGSIGDYLGLPLRVSQVRTGFADIPASIEVSELPLRAVAKIYNDWFRDENSIAPVVYTIGDTANTAIKYSDPCFKVSRFHDMFSSALPAPQKGGSITLPLGTEAPVVTGATEHTTGAVANTMKMRRTNGSALTGDFQLYLSNGEVYYDSSKGSGSGAHPAYPSNLYADLTNATSATINALRTAFQVQRLLEKDARGGTRYIELLRAHFGVTSPDARLQRSEYLAGQRFRINVDQVVATADSGSTGSSIVGQTGAVSKTANVASFFTKSFVEHGMVLGFVCIRQDHTYSQGLDRFWLKKERFDFYYPVLANLGEVPLYKSEIYCRTGTSGSVGQGSGVFGYQECWFDYRFKPSRCSAYMAPHAANSLNYWTLGDAYTASPSLNKAFLEESPLLLDRALQVQSSTMHQFIADFYFKAKYGRVMPVYSIPGLIDHH